jgi:hypothetical protein
MVGLFEVLKRKFRLARTAFCLTKIFDSAFAPFRGPGGVLDGRVRADEFVVAYMYGVMAYLFERLDMVGDKNSDAAVILWKCYDRVFPGFGEEIVELSVARIKFKETKFYEGMGIGWKEARLRFESKGKSGLPSLTNRMLEITAPMRCLPSLY